MPHKTVELRYGKGCIGVSVPQNAAVLRNSDSLPAVEDADAAVKAALMAPIGSPSLTEIVGRKRPRSVAITISDITRPVPNQPILRTLLEVLNAGGVSDEQVTIIIGTGMHRPSTPAEREQLLGDVLPRCKVIDHKANDRSTLATLKSDPAVSVNRVFLEADLRIVTGLIEPHFMAGYSGGRKGVCPALVDLSTVQRFHGYEILSDPRSTNGVLDRNPCHAESLRIAKLVGIDFLVNVVINHERQLAGVYAGEMEAAHACGVEQVRASCVAYVDQPFDLVITSASGAPLDETFYQSVKGMVGALPAMHDGSTLLLAANCGEGVGSEAYREIMFRWHDDWRGFLKHIASTPTVAKDQWEFQMHCRVLEKVGVERIGFACDGLDLETQQRIAVTPLPGQGGAAQRLQRAVDDYLARNPGARVAVIPDGPYTMLAER